MALNLRIDLYADGADVRDMVAARDSGLVKGFTTNPTLMRKSGIFDYEAFAREALKAVSGMPISFEVFAGRIADTGRDPVPIMCDALSSIRKKPKAKLLWASPRELLNIFQADACGCHIITVTSDILKKLAMVGKSLDDLSLDTVKMF